MGRHQKPRAPKEGGGGASTSGGRRVTAPQTEPNQVGQGGKPVGAEK